MLLFNSFVPAIVAFLLIIARINANPALMRRLVNEYQSTIRHGLPNQGACTRHNLAVRKEWYVCSAIRLTQQDWLPLTPHPLIPQEHARYPDAQVIHQRSQVSRPLTLHNRPLPRPRCPVPIRRLHCHTHHQHPHHPRHRLLLRLAPPLPVPVRESPTRGMRVHRVPAILGVVALGEPPHQCKPPLRRLINLPLR
jgi:hypothetical protein